MKLSKKSFTWLAFTIEVWLTDSALEGFREEALAGVFPHTSNEPTMRIWFKGLVTPSEVVHECWHLFMTMLAAMDSTPKYFDELNTEIYAYSFHTLYERVLETVTGMKEYKKFWEKK